MLLLLLLELAGSRAQDIEALPPAAAGNRVTILPPFLMDRVSATSAAFVPGRGGDHGYTAAKRERPL
jgi:hypothetical protein